MIKTNATVSQKTRSSLFDIISQNKMYNPQKDKINMTKLIQYLQQKNPSILNQIIHGPSKYKTFLPEVIEFLNLKQIGNVMSVNRETSGLPEKTESTKSRGTSMQAQTGSAKSRGTSAQVATAEPTGVQKLIKFDKIDNSLWHNMKYKQKVVNKFIQHASKVKTIKLSDITQRDKIKKVQEFEEILLKNLDKFENLEVLSLRNINLTLGGLKMLVNKIAKLTNFKVLYLSLGYLNTTKFNIVDQLVKIFPDLQNLEKLALVGPGNNMNNENVITLANALPSLKNLKELDLNNNLLGIQGAITIANVLHRLPNLQRFTLNNNDIQKEGAIAIINALHDLPNLNKTIDLGQNNIGDGGAVEIAELLKGFPDLKILNLSRNHIRDNGAIAIANVLGRYLPELQILNLNNNQIGPAGIIAIANQLPNLKHLKVLYIVSQHVQFDPIANAYRYNLPQLSMNALNAKLLPTTTLK
jgi:Ran GTPase-activating protein (RanGAP) involved in mRNA processing and transport